MLRRRLVTLGTALVGLAGGALVFAPSSSAAFTWCQGATGRNCFNYEQQWQGANVGVCGNVPDFASPAGYFTQYCGNAFENPGPCNGRGAPLWNDAASDINENKTLAVRADYDQNYHGTGFALGSENSGVDMISLRSNVMLNNNRSQRFFS